MKGLGDKPPRVKLSNLRILASSRRQQDVEVGLPKFEGQKRLDIPNEFVEIWSSFFERKAKRGLKKETLATMDHPQMRAFTWLLQ